MKKSVKGILITTFIVLILLLMFKGNKEKDSIYNKIYNEKRDFLETQYLIKDFYEYDDKYKVFIEDNKDKYVRWSAHVKEVHKNELVLRESGFPQINATFDYNIKEYHNIKKGDIVTVSGHPVEYDMDLFISDWYLENCGIEETTVDENYLVMNYETVFEQTKDEEVKNDEKKDNNPQTEEDKDIESADKDEIINNDNSEMGISTLTGEVYESKLDNRSNDEQILNFSKDTAIQYINQIVKKYGADLDDSSNVYNTKKYIDDVDTTGFTKTEDENSYVLVLYVWNKTDIEEEVMDISYDIYKEVYNNLDDFNISQVSLIFHYKDYMTSAQISLGRNAIIECFKTKSLSPKDLYDYASKNQIFESEYLEDTVVGNMNGFIGLNENEVEWLPAGGNLYTGVKLYFGYNRDKTYIGQVLELDKNHYDLYTDKYFNGVKLEMQSGSIEWKDRDAIVVNEWYVRKDDPFLPNN